MIYFSIIVLLFSVGFFIYGKKRYHKNEQKIYNQIIKQKENKINIELQEKYNKRKKLYEEEEKSLLLKKEALVLEIDEKQKFNNTLFKVREEELNNLIQQLKKEKEENLRVLLKKEQEKIKNEYNQEFSAFVSTQEELKEKMKKETEEIEKVLNEARAKQSAINEQLRREEELQNEQDFHRILLSKNDKDDINYLISIEHKIHNKEILYKLIWSEYIQRAFNQMIKNVCGAKTHKNVIYCIENISNHKKYIGKTSGDVQKRWTEHIKNSLNIGGIKRQLIHDALYGHWDNFTFSILEDVKDEKLGDREKYYISFFETDKYGYNLKNGG